MNLRRIACFLALAGCGGTTSTIETDVSSPPDEAAEVTQNAPEEPRTYDDLERLRFNQVAVRLNLPLFWATDADDDGAVDPDEVRSLDFYTTDEVSWAADGAFTPGFDQAYDAIVAASQEEAPTDERMAAIRLELESTAPTLIETDLSELPAAHREFARHMRAAADHIDALYAKQVGMAALAAQVDAEDAAAQSLFRRNWGPRCRGAATEVIPACSAIANAPKQPVDVYPTAMQAEDGFCAALEARDDSAALLSPFTVVREGEEEGSLRAVPYHEAYAAQIAPLVAELRAAAEAISADEAEAKLVAYLRAAADAFESNDWDQANEAWAAMNAQNSKWYVRVGPDEVYWDPCSRKAGFHLTLALIDPASLEWQEKLTPIQEDMEGSLARLVRRYRARDVSFHMPDFIQIVINAGDDRDPFGATIGQSLPNWGPVAEEGRGRTVAMSNLYTDPDSQARRRALAATLLTEEVLAQLSDDPDAGLMSTILHEATHNLGPTSATKVRRKTPGELFGGGLASMLEELKAQTGALFFVPMLVEKEIISEEEAKETYLDSIVWAFGHISRGMTTPGGQRKPYSQLAAVQVGYLMEHGVLSWDPEATAADGETQGAFSVDLAKMPEVVRDLMKEVVRIKATGDRRAAEALANRYVPDDSIVPHEAISERYQRFPRTTFVYSVHF